MTTTTVSLDGLRELAAFRAEKGCAISLYVDLDPSVSPTPVTSRRGCARSSTSPRSHTARPAPDLAHEVKTGLKADFERLVAVLRRRVRPGWGAGAGRVRGRAGQRLERPVAAVVGSGCRTGRRRLPARAARAAARSRERCARRRCRPRAGTRAGASRRPARGDRRSHRGDARPPRSGRLVAGSVSSGTSRTSTTSTTGRSPRSWRTASADCGRPRIVSSAARTRVRSSRRRSLPRSPTRSSAGRAPRRTRPSADLHEAVKPFVEEWRAARESDVVERWREETGKGARGTAGWADTLEAASDGRVETAASPGGRQEGRVPMPVVRARRARTRSRARSTGRRWSRATTGSTSRSA